MPSTAKIILDSINKKGQRLTTVEVCYPRYVHDDILTHRQLSRNASSTRAIPISKFIQDTYDNPVEPIFMKNRPGMAATEKVSETNEAMSKYVWSKAHEAAVLAAQTLDALGVHKQVTNRLLMPFVNIRVIITATDWDNFFKLRLNSAAQQEVTEIATLIKSALDKSTPKEIKDYWYHMPYITSEEYAKYPPDVLLSISAARCARVSYDKIHGVDKTVEDDIKLAERLWEDGHLSPFEHQAMPITDDMNAIPISNFTGWIQQRHFKL
jgi:thymidylate synthase ThyX